MWVEGRCCRAALRRKLYGPHALVSLSCAGFPLLFGRASEAVRPVLLPPVPRRDHAVRTFMINDAFHQ
jgi:hypothetical protein